MRIAIGLAVASLAFLTACPPSSSGEGEGEGEGAAGEGEGAAGEGEGEGASCTSASKFAAQGTDFVLSAATFAANQNATCTTGSGFTLSFNFSTAHGQGYEPNFDASFVAVADNGVPAHGGTFGDCDGGVTTAGQDGFPCDGIADCSFTCSLCYTTAPTDLAVEVNDTGNTLSNALCVLP